MNKTTSTLTGIAAWMVLAGSSAQAAETEPRRAVSAREMLAPNDLDKDGIVTRDEAAKVNGPLFLMWGLYDLDRDNKLDEAEIYRATQEMMVGTAQQRITGDSGGRRALVKPEYVMASNDLDGDGTVTREEATKADKALIRMWDLYDLDKNGKLDLAEIRKAQPF